MIRMYIDGAANPKKKISGIGIVIIESGKQVQLSEKLETYFDNHEAELIALQYALDYLLSKKKQNEVIFCHSDSKMLVDAIEKKYSRKESHVRHLSEILRTLKQFPQFYLKWVPEKENKGADRLARNALK
ncbi:ribonuclease HI family protein [Jeotgalibaca sp. A127]|uniref:ribonuclease HI family protein n=1 Tax=Jeotgalibaca sp. A127 TaxID=3457324 RepID=UPI003FCFC9E8